jgi:hypothetical protein
VFDFDQIDKQALPAHCLYAGKRIDYRYYAGKQARELEKTFQRVAAIDEMDPDDLTQEEREMREDGGRRAICDALAAVLDSIQVKDMELDGKKMAEKENVPTAFYSTLARTIVEELMNGGVQARKSTR